MLTWSHSLKTKIKDVYSKLYYCYGSQLCRENDSNLFTTDLVVFDTMIVLLIINW